MSKTDRHIYKADGSMLQDGNGKSVEWTQLEYSGEWMGACNVSVDLSNEAPVAFSIGDYLIYRGERFEINYDPGKIKAEAKDWSGESFKYSGVVFNSMQDELVRSEFLDVVLSDNKSHYTALPKFAFYIDSLDGIADRLQANMDEQYGKGMWHFYTRNQKKSKDRGCDDVVWEKTYGTGIADNEIESTSISVSSQSCWDVLGLVNSQFDVNFIIRGRNVFIGTAGTAAAHIFRHGMGKGLYEIEEAADSGQSVITRLRAYGSDKNLPTNYYGEIGALSCAYVKHRDYSTDPRVYTHLVLDIEWDEKLYTDKIGDIAGVATNAYRVKVKTANGESVTGFVERSYTDIDGTYHSEGTRYTMLQVEAKSSEYPTHYPIAEENTQNAKTFVTAATVGKKIYFESGTAGANMPSGNLEGGAELPNNMAVNTLMLPGFPTMTLKQWWDTHESDHEYLNPTGRDIRFSEDKNRPYIESPNTDKIGVRPASVFFDTDNEKEGLKDIYPTIKEMRVGGVRIDEIDTGTEGTVTDNGVYKEGQTVPNFNIKLRKEINFDLRALAEDDFTVHMQDGMCGGREFKVAAAAKASDGRWVLRLERQQDTDLQLWFPYKDFPISAGDHFVLTGIKMPKEYIENASKELLRHAIAKLNDNDYTRKTYTPKVDEIFMARQNDEAEADETGSTKSLYQTLKEGDLMIFEDEDLEIDTRITIDKLTIKEQEGRIPTYDVTLKSEKEVGTIQKIQNQVSSIVSGSYGDGGFTNSQIEGMVTAVCKNLYLSKVSKDTARAVITLLKGMIIGSEHSISETGDAILRSLKLGDYGIDAGGNAALGSVEAGDIASSDYSETAQSGFSIRQRGDTKYKMTITDLEVWGKAVFHELEIRKLSYVGGNYIFSPAGCTLAAVDTKLTGVARCFFMAEDSDKAGGNMWRAGDLALCEEFDTDKRTKGNRRYWRKVMSVSAEAACILGADGAALYDGRKFHYIDLSTADCEAGSDTPRAGDSVCCLGNATDKERQNAIQIQTVGDMAPAIIQYEGITTYTLADKDKTVISPKGNKFIGEFYAKAGGASLAVSLDRLTDRTGDAESRIDDLETGQGEISLKVDAQAREYRNLVPGSMLRLHSRGYGVGRRDVVLEQGKTYTMSAKGAADQALTDGGGELAVFVYNDAWTWAKRVALKSAGTASVTFGDVPENGVYHVSAYAYHGQTTGGYGNMMPQEKGTFTLDCVQIEEGSQATAWTPSEEDAAVSGNLLRRIDEQGWILADGTETQQDAYIADGRHTAVAHLRNGTGGLNIMLSAPTDVEGESVYTLSFWAKGTGAFTSHLYPDSVTYAEDNQGHSSAYADGAIENTLTTDWRKYAVRISTRRKAENMLLNAAFASGFAGWSAVGTWTIDGSSIDSVAAARLTALQGGYGELVQTVGGVAQGSAYTLQMTVIGSVDVYLMGVSPEDVYVDGAAATPESGYLVALPKAENWTEHVITFRAGLTADMTLRLRSTAAGTRIGKPMLSAGHMRSAWRSREDRGELLVPVRLAAGSEAWVSAVKLEKNWRATEYTERTLTAADVLPAGLDIYGKKIIATADTFEVRNQQGETTTTVTADGQLTAGILSTQNRGEGYLRAEDGMMEVYNPDGRKNIRFGLDKNSGMMVLEYYNNQGVLLYNLGPGGLTNRGLQTASLETMEAEHAGTFFNNQQKIGSLTVYSDDVYYTADDGCCVIYSQLRSRLMPTASTTAGYQPVSARKEGKPVYYYQAARVQTAYAVDEDNGITTEALAKEADQRWFAKKPICEDGALNLLTSDAQIMDGEKLHWGTRGNGLKQLAIYMYEWYEGERERKEIFVGD